VTPDAGMLYNPEPSPIKSPLIVVPLTTKLPVIRNEPVNCKSFVVA